MLRLFSILYLLTCLGALHAQKALEGRIDFKMNYLSFPDGDEAKSNVLPSQSSWYIDAVGLRIQEETEVGGKTVEISLSEEDSTTILFELGGKDVFFRKKKAAPQKFRVKEIQKEREWDGVKLTKFILQNSMGGVYEFWCDKRYANPVANQLPDLKYLPVEFQLEEDGVLIQYAPLSIHEFPLDETYFSLPDSYVRVNEHTLQKIVK